MLSDDGNLMGVTSIIMASFYVLGIMFIDSFLGIKGKALANTQN